MLKTSNQSFSACCVVKKQQELIAADTREQISGTELGAKALGNLRQQSVSCSVTVVIVDMLEVIYVEERQREGGVCGRER